LQQTRQFIHQQMMFRFFGLRMGIRCPFFAERGESTNHSRIFTALIAF
jgi:hypothetical protein